MGERQLPEQKWPREREEDADLGLLHIGGDDSASQS